MNDPLIILGRIVGAHGVQGWVRVHPFADDPNSWASLKLWWLAESDSAAPEHWREVAVSHARWSAGKLDVKLADVTGRTGAEALKGWYVAAPREAMPLPAADEYYWSDLLGLAVVNTSAESLGTIAEMLETGANDVMVVRDGETERLIPFIASVIDSVDLPAKVVKVVWERDW
jgi:16S rRNA processing protein RimM